MTARMQPLGLPLYLAYKAHSLHLSNFVAHGEVAQLVRAQDS